MNKKDQRNLLIIIVLIIILLIFRNIGINEANKIRKYGFSGNDRTHSVYYKITGTANTVDITLENKYGDTEQYDDVSLPYMKAFSVDFDQFIYISAQNQGSSGTVICEVYSDGALIEKATSEGAYVIATCSGFTE